MKLGEGPRKRVSTITRGHTDHMEFYCFVYILWVLLCFMVYMVVHIVCFCLVL